MQAIHCQSDDDIKVFSQISCEKNKNKQHIQVWMYIWYFQYVLEEMEYSVTAFGY